MRYTNRLQPSTLHFRRRKWLFFPLVECLHYSKPLDDWTTTWNKMQGWKIDTKTQVSNSESQVNNTNIKQRDLTELQVFQRLEFFHWKSVVTCRDSCFSSNYSMCISVSLGSSIIPKTVVRWKIDWTKCHMVESNRSHLHDLNNRSV